MVKQCPIVFRNKQEGRDYHMRTQQVPNSPYFIHYDDNGYCCISKSKESQESIPESEMQEFLDAVANGFCLFSYLHCFSLVYQCFLHKHRSKSADKPACISLGYHHITFSKINSKSSRHFGSCH